MVLILLQQKITVGVNSLTPQPQQLFRLHLTSLEDPT
jgi:hypothetical protein